MAGWQVAAIIVGGAVVGGALTLAVLAVLSRRPSDSGFVVGQLLPCPATPNCVCSLAPRDDPHYILPFSIQGDPTVAMTRLRAALERRPRTRVVTATDAYLRAECATLLFRFVDDVEFLLDRNAGEIHCRSASRVGHWDLGANRRRIESLRRLLDL